MLVATPTYGERYRDHKDHHMVFIYLEKAYDKISRTAMLWPLKKHKVLAKYIILVKDMFTNVVTSFRACDSETNTWKDMFTNVVQQQMK
jgi:hypothetical protein